MSYKDILSDEIKKLYSKGYTSDYKPLADLLEKWEDEIAKEEKKKI